MNNRVRQTIPDIQYKQSRSIFVYCSETYKYVIYTYYLLY